MYTVCFVGSLVHGCVHMYMLAQAFSIYTSTHPNPPLVCACETETITKTRRTSRMKRMKRKRSQKRRNLRMRSRGIQGTVVSSCCGVPPPWGWLIFSTLHTRFPGTHHNCARLTNLHFLSISNITVRPRKKMKSFLRPKAQSKSSSKKHSPSSAKTASKSKGAAKSRPGNPADIDELVRKSFCMLNKCRCGHETANRFIPAWVMLHKPVSHFCVSF